MGSLVLTFGGLIAFASLAGLFGEKLRLPRVTSYLLAGVIFGPSVLKAIGHDDLHHLLPVADTAMALVLFNLGARFSIPLLMKIREHIVPVAIGDLLCTFTVVAGGLWFFGIGATPAIMLGCLAMATAPATTILVLKELQSEGSVTESSQALVAINNLATILLFELLMILFMAFSGVETSWMMQFGSFAWTILGSVLVGTILGLVLGFSAGMLSTSQWMVVLLAACLIGLGACEVSSLSYMLVFLVTGFVYSNSTHDKEQDLVESAKFTTLLCVAFFAIHGAELQLDQFLKLGMIGAAYIVLRSAGKYLGIRIAASWTHESVAMRDWLGATMLSQAGAAIALAAAAVERDPETFGPVQTIILGSVIVFEILGPLMIRAAVLNSGEVPIAHVARHPGDLLKNQAMTMWAKLRSSFGFETGEFTEAQETELTVASLARSKISGIAQTANLQQIISHVEHSPDNTFPVINKQNEVVGIIRYPHLSEMLFDPTVSNLVCAEDIATPVECLVHPDDPAATVFDFFTSSNDDCIPIVSREPPRKMEGVVRRSDIRTFLIRSRKKGSGH